MAVAVPRRAGELQDNHVGPVMADGRNHIRKNAIVPPFRYGFFGRFREAEIDGAGEKLFRPIHAASRQQLLRANHAQQVALFRTDQVLPTLAARRR